MSKKRKRKGGDCYEAALHFAAWTVPVDERDAYRVVHGYPTVQGPIEGIVHGHAWVERTDPLPDDLPEIFADSAASLFTTVIDKSNGKDLEMPVALYYGYGSIYREECHYYTVEEAVRLALESGHYGPWHDESESPAQVPREAEMA